MGRGRGELILNVECWILNRKKKRKRGKSNFEF
jgi:hypothetical protein